jgi:ABC-type transport system involved in multi-copper enzyme maturation permease subunit
LLTDIVRFEWRYHTRQVSFLAALLIYATLGFALTATGFGPDNIHLNSPYTIAESLGLLSLTAVFAIAVFCASAVVRDREYQMEEIIFSTPVEKFPLLFGRFAGSFLAAFTAFSATAIGMLIALAMPWQDAARIGAIAPHHYVWTLVVLVLPGMLFAAALLFGVAALTRSMIATVVGAVAIYVLYFIASALTNSPLMASSVAGADTAAGASLFDPFGLAAFFEQTRYWTAATRNTHVVSLTGTFLLNRVIWIGAAALIFLWTAAAKLPLSKWSGARPRAPERFGGRGRPQLHLKTNSPLLSTLTLELRLSLLTIPFALLTLLWIALAVTEILSDLSGEYGTVAYPVPGFMLMTLQQPLTLVALILVIWYSAEIVWRERTIGISEVIDATPAPRALFALAKWIALSVMIVVLIATGALAAALVQVMRDYTHFEPGVMLAFACLTGIPLIVVAAIAMLVQRISPNKYAGMLLVLIAAIALRRAYVLAGGPSIEYSSMNGFFLNRSVNTLDWRADYEKTYRPLPQPRVTAVTANVSLFPRERRYRITGAYRLANETNTPIDTVLVAVRRDARVASMSLSNAKLTKDDQHFAMHTFRLDHALQPGQQVELRFDLTCEHPSDPTIVENGTYLLDRRAFPTIGYRNSYEIRDAAERKKRGLAPIADRSEEDTIADEWIAFDLTISTDADQLALTSGDLVRQWTTNNRRHFHYRSDALHSVFAIASARYKVAQANGIELYYTHPQNIARMLGAAIESKRLFEQTFGPYPLPVLRLAEVPAYLNAGGFATHGLIVLPENRTFLIDARDPRRIDLVTRRVAHEVAHQWWGHRVAPPDAPGATAIVESLAKYSELLVLEKKYGRDVVRQSLAHELDLYLAGRTTDSQREVPLSRSGDQSYLYYRKGSIVMYALRDLLGEPTFHRALRNFVDEQGGAGHQPRFADLARHIKAVAPPQHHQLIDQWLNDIVLYDIRLASTNVKPTGNRYEVTMTIDTNLRFDESIEVGLFARDESPIAVAHQPLHRGRNTIVMIADKKPDLAIADPYVTRVDVNRFDNVRPLTP